MASMNGHDLDVADRAADLDDDDVDVLVGQPPDAVLDLVGDVRDDLHRPPEEVAAPLLLDDRAVDAARSWCWSASRGSRR